MATGAVDPVTAVVLVGTVDVGATVVVDATVVDVVAVEDTVVVEATVVAAAEVVDDASVRLTVALDGGDASAYEAPGPSVTVTVSNGAENTAPASTVTGTVALVAPAGTTTTMPSGA